MSSRMSVTARRPQTLRRKLTTYFVLTFAISWVGALAVAAPHWLRQEPVPKVAGLTMFPVMLLGPSVAGVALTRFYDGKAGVRALFASIFWPRVPALWWTILLIFPAAILAVLYLLKAFVSPEYSPNHFWMGVLFGLPAGLLKKSGGPALRPGNSSHGKMRAGRACSSEFSGRSGIFRWRTSLARPVRTENILCRFSWRLRRSSRPCAS